MKGDLLQNFRQGRHRLPAPDLPGQRRVDDQPGDVETPRFRNGRDGVTAEPRTAPAAQLSQGNGVTFPAAEVDDAGGYRRCLQLLPEKRYQVPGVEAVPHLKS